MTSPFIQFMKTIVTVKIYQYCKIYQDCILQTIPRMKTEHL